MSPGQSTKMDFQDSHIIVSGMATIKIKEGTWTPSLTFLWNCCRWQGCYTWEVCQELQEIESQLSEEADSREWWQTQFILPQRPDGSTWEDRHPSSFWLPSSPVLHRYLNTHPPCSLSFRLWSKTIIKTPCFVMKAFCSIFLISHSQWLHVDTAWSNVRFKKPKQKCIVSHTLYYLARQHVISVYKAHSLQRSIGDEIFSTFQQDRVI